MQQTHQPVSTPVPAAVVNPVTPVQTPVPQANSADTGSSIGQRLVRARLGVYTGLYYALRAKHPPTAGHALRVAIGCSKWAIWRKMPQEQREILEVAALLHDVGKIGVPDVVLQKPERLNAQELLMIDMQVGVGEELLREAGAGAELLEIVANCRKRCDEEQELSIGARMLAIVDAFDAMTTQQVFRRAVSRDRAIEELCTHAGTQFDAKLVREFAELIAVPRKELESAIAKQWLSELYLDSTSGFATGDAPVSSGAVQNILDSLFHYRLLDTIKDAAVYLDASGQVLHWNRSAESMTGRAPSAAINLLWNADLMGLTEVSGDPISECPLERVMKTSTQVSQRFKLTALDGRMLHVQFAGIPVFSKQQTLAGVILIVQDASQEENLERRVQSLNEIATKDPLTKVANRAALNEYLPKFFETHSSDGRPGSLIICDIDFFKRINDTHGHPAGDEALVTFAAVLSENAREGDLVVRFGGEEFVVLCAGCDNPAATVRAEQMRQAVEATPVPSLEGTAMTASFGVTEIQPGDDAETLLARADRALLTAKENGRNRVVQLGVGQDSSAANNQSSEDSDSKPTAVTQRRTWLQWLKGASQPVAQAEYLAAVPREVAIQKLQGFIHDRKAELLSIKDSHIAIRVDGSKGIGRRKGERQAVMIMEVKVQTVDFMTNGRQKNYQTRTRFQVCVRPVRARDRRAATLNGQGEQLLHSFRSYLVAQEIDDKLRASIIEPR